MSVKVAKRVLAVGAHPDDCEILCGGTLARYAELGATVTICSIANGDKGHRTEHGPALAKRRRREAQDAAAVIGAESLCLDVPDGEIDATDIELRARLIEVIRRVQPDVILTHWPDDYHADHQNAGRIATEASWYAASAGHLTETGPLPAPVPIFYMDTVAGLGFEPTEFVDISAVIAKKEQMLRAHASQMGEEACHGVPELLRMSLLQAQFRGFQCDVPYAEAFRLCLKWRRIKPYRLLP